MTFTQKLRHIIKTKTSLLCLGLDVEPELIPPGYNTLSFNQALIEATQDLVIGYKLNFAFYESLGKEGWEVLAGTRAMIPPDTLSIADAKRGDIAHSARLYARAIFDELSFDATTVNPYLGRDSLQPWVSYKGKGIFVLCHTSNPSACDLQQKKLAGGESLYQAVASMVASLNIHQNLGLVVGATHPGAISTLRQAYPDLPFLIPGVGPQGGDLEKALRLGLDNQGSGVIISISREIISAAQGGDFARARRVAESLRAEIQKLKDMP